MNSESSFVNEEHTEQYNKTRDDVRQYMQYTVSICDPYAVLHLKFFSAC